MKNRTLPRLLEPKSITFGFTVFYFFWTLAAWLRGPVSDYPFSTSHENVFVAAMLFVSAAGLVLNRAWSKLLAAILSGQMPLLFLFIFWITAERIDASLFSPAHITRCLDELAHMPMAVWLWLFGSGIILAYAVPSIVRAGASHKSALMPENPAALPPHAHLAQEHLRRFTTHATSAGPDARHHATAHPLRHATPTGG